jgi:hypothetical protein
MMEPLEIIEKPNYVWSCEVMPKVYWRREEGQQPNAFHRLMQRLVFGFKWERIEEERSDALL